jgi:KDO2-lipid IV(A) lauroyltransferase
MPFGLIYLFSHYFYFVIYYVFPYRKKVVLANLAKSFPTMEKKERAKIAKEFYRYLTFLLAESIKNLTISEDSLRKRMIVRNPEMMDRLYEEGRDVLLLSSHYHNWEMLITAQNLVFKHQAIGIGMPMSNKFWDKKINERRERFGMKVVNANNYKEVLAEQTTEPTATLILGDQSPGKDENCYWVDFLHQKTAFYFGAEILANQTGAAVVYAVIHLVKRGHYEIELREITSNPSAEQYGHITGSYISFLEEDIHHKPSAWLWSHKRWKKQIPENLFTMQSEHEARFLKRFGKR